MPCSLSLAVMARMLKCSSSRHFSICRTRCSSCSSTVRVLSTDLCPYRGALPDVAENGLLHGEFTGEPVQVRREDPVGAAVGDPGNRIHESGPFIERALAGCSALTVSIGDHVDDADAVSGLLLRPRAAVVFLRWKPIAVDRLCGS
jgi:hypothetical protein